MTSKQMAAFRIQEEKPEVLTAYGQQQFRPRPRDGPPPGRDRRAVRRSHAGRLGPASAGLRRTEDAASAAPRPGHCRRWTADLSSRGMLEHTVIVCMGEFGRTPRINQDVGRDHWAQSWSVMMGGGGLQGGPRGRRHRQGRRGCRRQELPPRRHLGDRRRTPWAFRSTPSTRPNWPADEDRQRRHADSGTDQLSRKDEGGRMKNQASRLSDSSFIPPRASL